MARIRPGSEIVGSEMPVQRPGSHSEQSSQQNPVIWLLAVIAVVLVLGGLRATAWISSTLTFAFFAVLALHPVDRWIRSRVPRPFRWLGVLAALLLMFLVFALFTAALMFVVQQLAAGVAKYQEPLQRLAERIGSVIEFAGPSGGDSSLAARLIDPLVALATGVAQSIWSLGGILVLLFFLVWLTLLEIPSYTTKLSTITTKNNGATLHELIEATGVRLRRYLMMRAILGLVTGMLYMAWVWWWDLDFVLVWGLLAFLLNFIPTIGSIIAGALPAGLAFIQHDPITALTIAAGLLFIEQFMGNYIDPKLQGQQLSLSAVAVLVGLTFWTWMWGLIGSLLAVPITLLITMICARIQALKPIAMVLSDAKTAEELEKATALKE